jgi:hypothetical protein
MRISFVFSLDKWQLVSLDYTATFLWLSQARIWISNAMCLFFLMFSKLKWGIVVHLVDIGWIDYTRCLNTLFIKYPCKNITYVLQCHACVNCSKMLYTCAFFFVLSYQIKNYYVNQLYTVISYWLYCSLWASWLTIKHLLLLSLWWNTCVKFLKTYI